MHSPFYKHTPPLSDNYVFRGVMLHVLRGCLTKINNDVFRGYSWQTNYVLRGMTLHVFNIHPHALRKDNYVLRGVPNYVFRGVI